MRKEPRVYTARIKASRPKQAEQKRVASARRTTIPKPAKGVCNARKGTKDLKVSAGVNTTK